MSALAWTDPEVGVRSACSTASPDDHIFESYRLQKMNSIDLAKYDQQHLTQFMADLSEQQQANLLAQIADIDFDQLKTLIDGNEEQVDWAQLASIAEPPPAIELGQPAADAQRLEARHAGEALLRDGRIGLILVAGGQGSRLGFDQPRACFPLGH